MMLKFFKYNLLIITLNTTDYRTINIFKSLEFEIFLPNY